MLVPTVVWVCYHSYLQDPKSRRLVRLLSTNAQGRTPAADVNYPTIQ